MLAPVPTRPRSNPFRRRRGAAPPPLPLQIVEAVTAAKRPADSSASATSSFRSVVVSTTSSTALAAAQRPGKRPRRPDAGEARPAASECSEIIGGGGSRPRPAEVEASESSCLGSVLESDLTCPEHEQLADDADTTDYSSACGETTQSEAEEEVLSAPCPCNEYDFLSPLVDLTSPSSSEDAKEDDDDDDAAAPSLTFSFFLEFAKEFVPCELAKAHVVADIAMPEVSDSTQFL
jgi:hypothetical protein